MIKVGLLSFWHVHAGEYAGYAQEHPDTEIAAVWDEIPERGRKEADARGVKFYESLEELLAQSDIDAVIVDAPTNMHRDVIVASAKAGKHIFTEKVIAPTLKECNEILAAVEQSGVKLTVSLPRLNDSYTLAIQDILNQGLLGDITLGRVRLSHGGAIHNWLPAHFYNLEQCAGGALIDLGCHPMYLTRLFLGMPESVSAHYGYITSRDVEDNAVSVLKYENGAIGVVEAGFVNSHSPFSIELHGKDGTALFGTPNDELVVRSTKLAESKDGWTARPIGSGKPSAFEQWVGHMKNDTIAEENIQLAVDLTKLMEASNLSAKLGRSVRLDELAQ